MKKFIYIFTVLIASYFVFHKLLSIYESYAGFEVYHLQTIFIQALPVLVSVVMTFLIGLVVMNTATSKLSVVSKYLITSYTIFLIFAITSILFSHYLLRPVGLASGYKPHLRYFDITVYGYVVGPISMVQNRTSELIIMFLIPAALSLIASFVTGIRNTLLKNI